MKKIQSVFVAYFTLVKTFMICNLNYAASASHLHTYFTRYHFRCIRFEHNQKCSHEITFYMLSVHLLLCSSPMVLVQKANTGASSKCGLAIDVNHFRALAQVSLFMNLVTLSSVHPVELPTFPAVQFFFMSIAQKNISEKPQVTFARFEHVFEHVCTPLRFTVGISSSWYTAKNECNVFQHPAWRSAKQWSLCSEPVFKWRRQQRQWEATL